MSKANIGKIKNSDRITWRKVKELMKMMRNGDELGFIIGRTHWTLIKTNN